MTSVGLFSFPIYFKNSLLATLIQPLSNMRFFSLFIFLFSFASVHAQQVDWFRHFKGPGVCYPQDLDVDANGNYYITGIFDENFDADPGPGVTTLTTVNGWDIFIIKMDPQLNLVWAKSIGGISFDTGEALKIDADGNILISGKFNETVDFDPGPGVANLVEPANFSGLSVAYLAKYTSDGEYIYAYSFNGFKESRIRSLDVDAQSNVYFSGTFGGTMDADPGPGTTTLTSKPNVEDPFFCKFNKAGNLCWAKKIEGGDGYDVFATVVDDQGGFFASGIFYGKTDFDPGPDSAFVTTKSNVPNMFILHLDTAGNYKWVRSFGKGYGNTLLYKPDGHILFGGNFEDTVDFEPGPGVTQRISKGNADNFIINLNAQGNLAWVQTFGGTGQEGVREINLDNNGNLYASGFFSGTVDFDPGPATANFTSNDVDIFVSKFSATGTFQSAFTLTGVGNQVPQRCFFGTDNDPIVMGHFTNTMTIRPTPGTFSLTSAGKEDFFLAHVIPGTTANLDLTEAQGINLFPNPTNNVLHIKGMDLVPGTYTIFNSLGKQMETPATSNNGLDVAALPSGLYQILIRHDGRAKTLSWVKE